MTEDRTLYKDVLRQLVHHFRGIDLRDTIYDGWVDEETGECCPILDPMRGMIGMMRSRSKTKPKVPGQLPPVTKVMIQHALRAKGLRWRLAENFALEYDAAVSLGERPRKALIYAIRAAALREEELRGSQHLMPVVLQCMHCEFMYPLVDGRLKPHVDLLTKAPCTGRVRSHEWPDRGLSPDNPSFDEFEGDDL